MEAIVAGSPGAKEREADLWFRWRHEGDGTARDKLVHHYLEYARIIAAKLYRTRYNDECEFADYLQFATIGMLEAMETFDPDREVTFRTFSSRRIHGSVLDGIHASSETHRQISARKMLLAERTDSLASDNADRDAAVAAAGAGDTFLGLVEVAIGLALGYMLEGSAMYHPADDTAAIDSGYERIEFRQLQEKVTALVRSLPPRESTVIHAHYFNQVAFQDIARALGVSKVRICQLHRQALERLYRKMVELRLTDLAA